MKFVIIKLLNITLKKNSLILEDTINFVTD